MVVDTPVSLKMQGYENGYREGAFFWVVNSIYFQYYGLLIFVVSGVVMLVVSYLTAAPRLEDIEGLTYGIVSREDRGRCRRSWNWTDAAASIFVLVAIVTDTYS